RTGVTGHHLRRAQCFLDSIANHAELGVNPAIKLFAECVAQLTRCLPNESLRIFASRRSLLAKPLADIANFGWQNYSATRLTVPKKIGWDISQKIVNGFYPDERIGSEETL